MAELALLADLEDTLPTKWSHASSCQSSAGEGKFAGQGPTL